MTVTYDPHNWYWLADDGRVFGSPNETIVTDADPDYQAWVAAGNAAAIWPRDEQGNQTNASLQEVLEPYNLYVDLHAYTLAKRYETEQAGILMTTGMPLKTDDRSQAKINGLFAATTGKTNVSTNFHAADGTYWPLDELGIVKVSTELQGHINQCFTASMATQQAIDAGTVTTRDQVDEAFNFDTTLGLSKRAGRQRV